MARKIPFRHQNEPKIKLKIRIKKDDTVKVIAGRDKGKTGRVLHVDRVNGRVLVEGVSMVKRHTRPNPSKQIKGGIAEQESPIAISNVMVVCPSCGPSRIGHKREGSRNVRICRRCDTALDKQ